MLTSFSLFQSALERYQKSKKKKEKYSVLESGTGGLAAGLASGFLVLAIIFLALEFIVMFFGINIAIKCTKSGPERIIHIVLAIAFTFPYVLLSIMFNKCAVDTIRGNNMTSTNIDTVNMSFCGNKL